MGMIVIIPLLSKNNIEMVYTSYYKKKSDCNKKNKKILFTISNKKVYSGILSCQFLTFLKNIHNAVNSKKKMVLFQNFTSFPLKYIRSFHHIKFIAI